VIAPILPAFALRPTRREGARCGHRLPVLRSPSELEITEAGSLPAEVSELRQAILALGSR